MKRVLLVVLLSSVAACTCSKKPVVEALKKEGEACQTDESCETGLCDAPAGVQPVCVRKCSSVCKQGEVCTQLTPNRFACQPDERKLCQPCMADSDCPYPSDKCVVVNGEKVCGRDCAYDQTCPTGYQCVNARGVDGLAKISQCTPIIASCACLARGDFNQPCEVTNEFGTCKGTKQCDLVSNTIACGARTPAAESCNGIDDNCDLRVDEGQGVKMCGVGECARTVDSCATDGGIAQCVPGQPTTELCNGKDDNCDGTVDEGFAVDNDVNNCGACLRVCTLNHATPKCETKTCKVATCDTGWGNCNNRDDDGCETNTTNDPMNCGGCGNMCPTSANQTPSCVNSSCMITCAPGYVDADHNPNNGCECHKTSDTDLPDSPNFVDANCDGIDGELTNAIYVSPSGDDSADGLSPTTPKKTLSAAIAILGPSARRDIYMATGAYTGPLDLGGYAHMVVAGGYDFATLKRALGNNVTISGGNPALTLDSVDDVEVQLVRFVGANATTPGQSAIGGWIKNSTSVKLNAVSITAGNGANGANGAPAGNGAKGGNGGDGEQAQDNDFNGPDNVECQLGGALGFADRHTPAAGPAGVSSCGVPGGTGGTPSRQMSTSSSSSSVPVGGAGIAAPGGGAGGKGVPENLLNPDSTYDGVAGAAGSAGSAGAASNSVLSATGYSPGDGADGSDGVPGRGGGGGGGGAGGWVWWHIPLTGVDAWCQGWGGGGGGGGAGGCGGGKGFGGKGGGASIGLLVTGSSSTVTVSGGTSLNLGNGGRGGDGTAGGTGGDPGSAGGSSGPDNSLTQESHQTRGGRGGAGGKGGAGGAGAGGSGGRVIGVVRAAGSPTLSVPVLSHGTAGAAGGGPVPGTAGTYSVSDTYP